MDRKVCSREIAGEMQNSILDIHYIGVRQCDIAEYYKLNKSNVSKILKPECDEKESDKREHNIFFTQRYQNFNEVVKEKYLNQHT